MHKTSLRTLHFIFLATAALASSGCGADVDAGDTDIDDVGVRRDPVGGGQSLQIAALTTEDNHRLLHTIRNPNGTWTPFRNVEEAAGEVGMAVSTALRTNQLGETHLLVVNQDWDVHHAIRKPDGTWRPWGNVETQAGSIGNAQMVAVADIGEDTHVLAKNEASVLYHTIRFASGSWQAFGNVGAQAGNIGGISDFSATSDGNVLHVCAVGGNHSIYHTMRLGNGAWTPYFRVTTDDTSNVSCTMINGTLHLLRVRRSDDLRHALEHRMRTPDGNFSVWDDVNVAAGSSLTFARVSSSEVAGNLHVVANSNGTLYHAIRYTATTGWTVFGNVNAATRFVGWFYDSESD